MRPKPTYSSCGKAQALTALGVDEVINYRTNRNWGERARELTDGRGVDRVIEVGGPATINQSLRAVAAGGEVALVRFLSADNPGIDYFLLKGADATTRSITVGDRTDLQDLVRAIATSGLKPVVDEIFEYSDARQAFERLRDGKHIGKLVIGVS